MCGVIIRRARADQRELIARIHRAAAERAYENIFPPDEAFPWDQTLARWLNFVGEVLVAESHETDDLIGFVSRLTSTSYTPCMCCPSIGIAESAGICSRRPVVWPSSGFWKAIPAPDGSMKAGAGNRTVRGVSLVESPNSVIYGQSVALTARSQSRDA
jgi:hypothetical protein